VPLELSRRAGGGALARRDKSEGGADEVELEQQQVLGHDLLRGHVRHP